MSDYSLLLVDDDQEILDSFAKWFARLGFHVTTAHHPRLALAAAAYNKFDAAVIDMTLPEMNGFDLIDKLKGIQDHPIIVLSGDVNPRLLDAATERGVYRFLVKPVSMRAVEEVIRESIVDLPSALARQTDATLESVS